MSALNLCRAQTCSCSFQPPGLPRLRSPNPEWLKTCPVWKIELGKKISKRETDRDTHHREICTGRPKILHQIYKPSSEQTVPFDVAILTRLILHIRKVPSQPQKKKNATNQCFKKHSWVTKMSRHSIREERHTVNEEYVNIKDQTYFKTVIFHDTACAL